MTESEWREQYRTIHRDNLLRTVPGATPGLYQWHWRVQPPPQYDAHLAELAIIDALIEQGGCVAWHGDGVGCVAQMIEAQAIRAEKAEAEVVRLKELLRKP